MSECGCPESALVLPLKLIYRRDLNVTVACHSSTSHFLLKVISVGYIGNIPYTISLLSILLLPSFITNNTPCDPSEPSQHNCRCDRKTSDQCCCTYFIVNHHVYCRLFYKPQLLLWDTAFESASNWQ